MKDTLRLIVQYVKFGVRLIIHLIAAAFVIAVLASLLIPNINPVGQLVNVINSFVSAKSGFAGLLALVVFVYFVSLFKADKCVSSECDTKKCNDSDHPK